jgi:hypothetical protein
MTLTNNLPYYPRFIFNCSDEKCLSTGDLDWFKNIKQAGSVYDITSFKTGQKIDITWIDKQEIKTYLITKIDINHIKYDLDEPTYGMNAENDCSSVKGKTKKWMMEIYIYLELIIKQ